MTIKENLFVNFVHAKTIETNGQKQRNVTDGKKNDFDASESDRFGCQTTRI